MNKRSFTFIELLLVVAVFSLLSLAVYSTFNSGLGLWHKIQDTDMHQRKTLLRLEKISLDLHQALNFSKIGFTGQKNEVSFPLLSGDKILKISYYYEGNSLYFKGENFSDIIENRKNDIKPKELLSGIEDLTFSFAYQEPDKNEYSWKDNWKKTEGIPLVVKIELKLKNAIFTKTIPIPVS